MNGSDRGIILFAHGARDPRWAEPFERLRDLLGARAGATPVRLAFLELMQPDLAAAADALIAEGCATLAIVPIFFGQGSHLRRDLPLLVDALRTRMPGVTITVAPAAGEDEAVLVAVADYSFRASQAGAP